MDPRRREIFMNIPAARGQAEQCFEELRMSDYLKAYSATGRSPQPCPPLPLHPAERAQLGLPPHFQPYIEVGGLPSTEDPVAVTLQLHGSTSDGPPPQELSAVPDTQMFSPTVDVSESGQTVYLQTIAAQHAFSRFSFEELRVQAYRAGKIIVPIPKGVNNTLVPTLMVTPPALNTGNEQFESITCTPSFEKHSFEELQLAYRRVGRELNSEQIVQMKAV